MGIRGLQALQPLPLSLPGLGTDPYGSRRVGVSGFKYAERSGRIPPRTEGLVRIGFRPGFSRAPPSS